MHSFEARLQWNGSTAEGVRGYSRDHVATAPPAGAEVALSADKAFRGDPELLNPEQLVVMAASSCQMLSFLAEAARAGIDVRSYEDTARADLLVTADPPRLSAIRLDVTVAVSGEMDEALVHDLSERAHRGCFIANSLAVPVEVDLTITST